MKKLAKITAIAAALAMTPAVAYAQDATVEVTAGATVTGNDDVQIGTVEAVTEDAVLVDTGSYKIPLPTNAFAKAENGFTLNITKTALEQAFAAQQAEMEAKLTAAFVEGAAVQTADAQPLGTIDTIENGNAIITRTDDTKVTLPEDMFMVDPQGALTARITMAALEEAMANQAGASTEG